MKFARILTKCIFSAFLVLIIAVFGSILYLENNISESFKIKRGDTLNLNSHIPLSAEYDGVSLTKRGTTQNIGEEFKVELKLLGIIPYKTVKL